MVQNHFFFQEMKMDPSNDSSYTCIALVLVTLLTVLGFFRKWVFKKTENFGKQRVLSVNDIPGPFEYFPMIIGSSLKFWPLENAFSVAMKWAKEYPGIAKVTGANRTFVVLHSCPTVQQFLKSSDFGHTEKAPVMYGLMKPFITNGVLVSNGTFWQGQRKILMKSQSFQSLKSYIELLHRHSDCFIQELTALFEDGQSHEINDLINVVFLKIINEMITGSDIKSTDEFNRYHENFQIWKQSLVKRFLNPWLILPLIWKIHPMSKTVNKATQELFEFSRRRIKEHKKKRNSVMESDDGQIQSVLDDLLDANVNVEQIVDEVNTMIFGGHETGATTIHFFCLCIATNPQFQAICYQEIDELFEDPENFRNGMLTYEAIQSNLKYLERCLLETLRLFPVVFLVIRELKTPFKVTHEDKTYLLPAGVNVAVSPYGMHRNAESFPNPDKFDPDRFLPEEVAKRHGFSYIPFSAGSRNCLGQKFAMIELKLISCYLLRNFVIRTKDKMEDVCLLPFVTITPKQNFIFHFTKRLNK